MKKFIVLSLFAVCMLFQTSCKSAGYKQALTEMVEVYSITPGGRAGKLVKHVKVGKQTVNISTIALITNWNMKHAECASYSEEKMEVAIELTRDGRAMWQQDSANLDNSLVAIFVGGKFKCFAEIEHFYNRRGAIKLYCKITEAEADKICNLIKRNYREICDGR